MTEEVHPRGADGIHRITGRLVPGGSMWGYQINGIWQDVYLLALPKIHLEDVYVKPLVSKNTLEIEVTLQNLTEKKTDVQLQGNIREWVNCAGTDINSVPVPNVLRIPGIPGR